MLTSEKKHGQWTHCATAIDELGSPIVANHRGCGGGVLVLKHSPLQSQAMRQRGIFFFPATGGFSGERQRGK